MRREEISDLAAFVVVAREKSFARAAAKLEVSRSTLSQIIRRFESRLGVKLVARTTTDNSVTPTEAGARLLDAVAPILHELDRRVEILSAFGDRPYGALCIASAEHPAKTVIFPALTKLARVCPDIGVKVFVDGGVTDIVAESFDAGVRLGVTLDREMIAVPISSEIPMAIVGSPEYFQQHPRPRKPSDLAGHRAVNLTLTITGATSTWRLMKNGQEISVRLEGSLTFNTIDLIIEAALCGWGIAHVPLDQVVQHLQSGRLMQVLKSWTPSLPAYHLYYSRRRHLSLAFNLFLDAVRVPPKEDDDDQNTPPRARS